VLPHGKTGHQKIRATVDNSNRIRIVVRDIEIAIFRTECNGFWICAYSDRTLDLSAVDDGHPVGSVVCHVDIIVGRIVRYSSRKFLHRDFSRIISIEHCHGPRS